MSLSICFEPQLVIQDPSLVLIRSVSLITLITLSANTELISFGKMSTGNYQQTQYLINFDWNVKLRVPLYQKALP